MVQAFFFFFFPLSVLQLNSSFLLGSFAGVQRANEAEPGKEEERTEEMRSLLAAVTAADGAFLVLFGPVLGSRGRSP